VAAGVSHKAFAEVAGKAMVARVLETLAAVPQIGRVIVVIEPGAPELPEGVERLDAASSPSRSALAGFERAETPVLVTTADHPLLTPEMVERFLADAVASGADVAAGVSKRAVVEQAGSTAKRTYLKFRDAHVSGCNLFALRTPKAAGALAFWRKLETERKRPLRMAWAIGPATLIRYVLGVLTTKAAARALGRAAGCRAAMVFVPFPDAAHDVDKPSDLAFAKARLAAREDG
jgi:GTP:adenosylcobinamide-phosphate guanylyltransferase